MKYVEYQYRLDLGCTRLSPGTPARGMSSIANRTRLPNSAERRGCIGFCFCSVQNAPWTGFCSEHLVNVQIDP
jgi:hypothetical protein